MTGHPLERRIPAVPAFPGLTAADLGEAITGTVVWGGHSYPVALVSYYQQPLLLGSRQDYVLFADIPMTTGIFGPTRQWTFIGPGGIELAAIMGDNYYLDPALRMSLGVGNAYHYWPGAPNVPTPLTHRKVRIDFLDTTSDSSDNSPGTVELTQSIGAVPDQLNSQLESLYDATKSISVLEVAREIGFELKSYIIEAATHAAIPARILAGVLFREAEARARDGTTAAATIKDRFRKRSEEYLFPNSMLWIALWNHVSSNGELHQLDDIREYELDSVGRGFMTWLEKREQISRLAFDPRTRFLEKSYGVGQMPLLQSAIECRLITDRTQPEVSWGSKLEETVEEFATKTNQNVWDVFNLIRFPKTNVRLAALFLSRLLRKPNRSPGVSHRALLSDFHALQLVAFEYNQGYSGRPSAEPLPSKDKEPIVHSTTFANRVLSGSADPIGKFLNVVFPDP